MSRLSLYKPPLNSSRYNFSTRTGVDFSVGLRVTIYLLEIAIMSQILQSEYRTSLLREVRPYLQPPSGAAAQNNAVLLLYYYT